MLPNAVPAPHKICVRRTARWVRSALHKSSTKERLNGDKALWRRSAHKSAQRRTPRRPSCSGCTALVARLRIKRDPTELIGPIEGDGLMTSAQPSAACAAPHHAARHLLPHRQNRAWRPSAAAAEGDGGDTFPACQSRPSAAAAGIRRPLVRAGEYCGLAWRPMPSCTPSDRGREADPACVCRQPPRLNTASSRLALLRDQGTEAGPGHGLAGPVAVPLCCGGERVRRRYGSPPATPPMHPVHRGCQGCLEGPPPTGVTSQDRRYRPDPAVG